MRQCIEFGADVVEWSLLFAGAHVERLSACNPESSAVHRIDYRDCGESATAAGTGDDNHSVEAELPMGVRLRFQHVSLLPGSRPPRDVAWYDAEAIAF